MKEVNRSNFLSKVKTIAALFKTEFPEKEEDVIEDISSIKQSQEEIIIQLPKRSYLREIIDSWQLTECIGGIYATEREIIIMLGKNTN